MEKGKRKVYLFFQRRVHSTVLHTPIKVTNPTLLCSRLCISFNLSSQRNQTKHLVQLLLCVSVFFWLWRCSQISSTSTSQTPLRKSSLSTYGEASFVFFTYSSSSSFLHVFIRVFVCLYVCVNRFVSFGEHGNGFVSFG
jgi:hypothetical protein